MWWTHYVTYLDDIGKWNVSLLLTAVFRLWEEGRKNMFYLPLCSKLQCIWAILSLPPYTAVHTLPLIWSLSTVHTCEVLGKIQFTYLRVLPDVRSTIFVSTWRKTGKFWEPRSFENHRGTTEFWKSWCFENHSVFFQLDLKIFIKSVTKSTWLKIVY